MTRSISIIIPAYNEEGNLEGAVKDVVSAIETANVKNYEILIFNDCSADKTGEVADGLAKENKSIRAIHNSKNMGLGYNYRKGIKLAKNEYVIMVPGDNEVEGKSIGNLFNQVGEADLIISYTANSEIRPRIRQIISKAFVKLMNFLFGLKLRYYNGICLIRKDLLQKVEMTTFGFAYMAEILTKLIKAGHSFVEVPMYIRPRAYGKVSVFRLKSIIGVLGAIFLLFLRVHFKERSKYNKYKKNEQIK